VSRAVLFGTVAAGLTLLVGVIGGLLVPAEARQAVWAGAGIAFLVQIVLFVVLFVIALARNPLLAHMLGIVGRFAALAMLAFLWVPLAGLPAAPFLFSAVSVLFLTTLMEPLVLMRGAEKS
jgi:hypothetical protein